MAQTNESQEQVTVNVETLQPVTRTLMTIGALPASYLISMTYEEQLLWLQNYLIKTVIPAINNNAEATQEVQDIVMALQDYINDYFNNLDVQEEINNKLEQMAQDGSLTNLIEDYVNPYINAQNQEIASFKTNVNTQITDFKNQVNNQMSQQNAQIQAVTTGSPHVASSVAQMTDTTRVYVNTSDGYWYYYNGTQWTQGGTYQATQNADGSITYNMLCNNLQNSLEGIYKDNTQYSDYEPGYMVFNGNVISDTANTRFIIEIDVNANETYLINRRYMINSLPVNQVPSYVLKDENNNVIIAKEILASDIVDGWLEEIIDIPATAKKLYINSSYVYNAGSGNANNRPGIYVLKLQNFGPKNKVNYNDFDNNLKEMFNIQYEEIDIPDSIIPNACFAPNNSLTTANGYNLNTYNVTPGENMKIEGLANFGTYALLIYTTKDMQTTMSVNSNDYSINIPIIKINDLSQVNTEFKIPDYCHKIYVLVKADNTNFKIYRQNGIKINMETVEIDETRLIKNPLNDKILCFTGDSITAASTSGVKGFVQLMQENNPTAHFYNYATDGWTIGMRTDNDHTIQNKLPLILNDHPDADYIILQGGANDAWQQQYIPLGEMSTGFNVDNFDRYTFAGGLEWMFNYIMENFPGKKVGFICNHQIRWLDRLKNYMDLAKAICKKWAIPYVDLYEEGQLNFNIPYMASHYSIQTTSAPNGDGTHPNLAGYEIETPKIENWLKYKI